VAAPVGSKVREWDETVRDLVVDLLVVGVNHLRVALADTLGDHARITLGVASVLAFLALHAGRVLEELGAESAAHNVVELLLNELVAVHLVNLLLALTDSTLTPETSIHRAG